MVPNPEMQIENSNEGQHSFRIFYIEVVGIHDGSDSSVGIMYCTVLHCGINLYHVVWMMSEFPRMIQ